MCTPNTNSVALVGRSSWVFQDGVDEGVLLSILEYLSPFQVLTLLASASTVADRLDEANVIPCQSIIGCLAMKHVGALHAEAMACALRRIAAQDSDDPQFDSVRPKRVTAGYACVLRVLASRAPMAAAFQLALRITSRQSETLSTLDADIILFLDTLFQAERSWSFRKEVEDKGYSVAAASAGLSSVVHRGDKGSTHLLHLAAKAVSKAEADLDHLYERLPPFSEYERAARSRSGAEFLRDRLPKGTELSRELDGALQELDRTVRGYVEEGFELECRFPRHGAPYAHWWLFLDGTGHWGSRVARLL